VRPLWILLALLVAPARAQVDLRFLDRPQAPLAAAYQEVGLDARAFELLHFVTAIGTARPIGPALFEALGQAGYRTIHVLWLAGAKVPDERRELVERFEVRLSGSRWRAGHLGEFRGAHERGEALVSIRLDTLVRQRASGAMVSPAGVLVHELAHAAQAGVGSSTRSGDLEDSYDLGDEAEAWLLESLVDQAEYRRGAAPPDLRASEQARLEEPVELSRRGQRRMARRIRSYRSYRRLASRPRYHPTRYRAELDPFRFLGDPGPGNLLRR
jgi:hypothetical protein